MAGIDREKLAAAIEGVKSEAARALGEIAAMDGAASGGEGEPPFSEGAKAAFDYMMKLAAADGFDADDVEGHGGHVEFGGLVYDGDGEVVGTSEEVLGMLGRLDARPAGAARGRGPAVACYYAMKALSGAGFAPEKKVRLILGLDGERGGDGLARYLRRFRAPDVGFSLDGDFPASCGAMGRLVFGLAKKLAKAGPKGLALRSLSGGEAPDAVPDFARAVVRGEGYEAIKEKAAAYRSETGRELRVKGLGKSLEISARGASAHGSRPEEGLNAISVLMDFLSSLHFGSEGVQEFLDFYNERIGFETGGESLGCGFSDEASGSLRLNPAMINGDDKAVNLTVAAYCPVSVGKEQVYEAILPSLEKNDMGLIKISCLPPVTVRGMTGGEPALQIGASEADARPPDPDGASDAALCGRLAAVYARLTGETERPPVISRSAFLAPEAGIRVAFGPRRTGDGAAPLEEGGAAEEARLFLLIGLYAEAIAELAWGD